MNLNANNLTGDQIEPNDEIKRICEKSGRSWTDGEVDKVFVWLNTEKLPYLLKLTSFHLGYGTTHEDAEDTLQKFMLIQYELAKRSRGVIGNYDATKSRYKDCLEPWEIFYAYLKFCLKCFCWKEGDRIRRRNGIVIPEAELVRDDFGQLIIEVIEEAEDARQDRKPDEAAIQRETALALQECINGLSPTYREPIVMYYFEGKSVREIALALQRTESNIKIQLYRGRQMLRDCLENKGIQL